MPARPRGGPTGEEPPARVDWVLAGRALVRGRLQPVEIGIDDEGRITRVARRVDSDQRTDVGDAVILPSATDLHVHFRDPGPPDAPESLAGGTLGAACGGVATVGEMPNTEPPVTTPERLAAKADRVAGRAYVDVLLFAALAPGVPVPALGRAAGGFKLYLAPTTGIPDPAGPAELGPLLAAAAETQLAVAVHAEDPSHFHAPGSASSVESWDAARPAHAERNAVERLLAAAPPALRLHVAHVTTPEVAGRLRAAGHSFESSAHHLLLADRKGADARFKVNPPLRTESERHELWNAFAAGEVPCLASDHAPHSLEAKAKPFAEAPSGMPGVETTLPLLLEKVRAGDLALATLLGAACDRPARWVGLPQGRIAPGHRANLLIVDFRRRATVRARDLHAACGWTAFEGFPAIFPRDHYVDGRRVLEDGEFVGSPRGRVVRPDYARGGRGSREPGQGV